MENQTETQRAGNPLSTGFIRESSYDEIKGVLKHIAFLIGLPDYKKPHEDTIIPYMKSKWGHITLKEITVAFESAVENLFIDVSLEGRTFSPEFMRRVILAHREFIGKNRQAAKDAQTNKQQVATVFSYYKENPELLEELKKVGNTKKFMTSSEIRKENEADKIYQDMIREFDKMYRDQKDQYGFVRTSIRMVKYGGRMVSLDEYLSVRAYENESGTQLNEQEISELLKAKEALKKK